MAIDTEDKRRSVSGYTGIPVYPLANLAISGADLAVVAGLYARAGASGLSIPAGDCVIKMRFFMDAKFGYSAWDVPTELEQYLPLLLDNNEDIESAVSGWIDQLYDGTAVTS